MTATPIDYESNCKLISPSVLHKHFGEELNLSKGDIISNEKHPESFYPFLSLVPSGMYLGVGGAQNYLFMQQAQPTSAILCDLSLPVMAAHHHVKSLVVSLSNFSTAEKEWYDLVTKPIDKWAIRRVPCTFPDLEGKLDEKIQRLYQEDNIDLFCADVFSLKTQQKIAERVHQRGERITTIYLSNALNCIAFFEGGGFSEQTVNYFSREEIFDPNGVVLQTIMAGTDEYSFPDELHHWHYSCLSIKKFCELMRGESYFSFGLLPLTEKVAVSCFR